MVGLKSLSSVTIRQLPLLNNTLLGFDLLDGTTLEQAMKAVALLNENVLNVFVTARQTRVSPGQ
jgi:hypothetical protein